MITSFGYIIGTTLISTLFLFDVFVTKFQKKKSLWGSTMTEVFLESPVLMSMLITNNIILWVYGLYIGNSSSDFQVNNSNFFWCLIAFLYGYSTYMYYKLKIHQLPKDDGKVGQ